MPDLSVLGVHAGDLAAGLLVTLRITLISFTGALVVGVLVAALRVSPVRLLRGVGATYVEVLQNVPLLAWLVVAVFVLPDVGVLLDLEVSAIIVLALYEGAYVAEATRSGINTVSISQGEAARALGLTFGKTMRYVVVPQALRAVVQPLGNLFIATTMNSALAAAVGVVELTAAANRANLDAAQPIAIFVAAGLVYMALSLTGGLLAGVIERRVAVIR